LDTGLKLLSSDYCWENQYDLTLELYVEAVEAAFLNTDFEQAEELSQVVLQHARTVLDKVKVYEIKIWSYQAQNEMQAAIDIGLQVLERLEVELVTTPPQALVIEKLHQLPIMTDDSKQAALRILMNLLAPVLVAQPALLPQIALTMLHICFHYGNSRLSAFTYVFYGLLLCAGGEQIEEGYQFGQLALNMLEKFEATEIKCKVHNIFNVFISHWKIPARESVEALQKTVQIGLETGDLEYAGHATVNYCSNLFLTGVSLETVHQIHTQYIELLRKIQQQFTLGFVSIWAQWVVGLRGKTENECFFHEEEMLPILQDTNNMTSLYIVYLQKMVMSYLEKDSLNAVTHAEVAMTYESAIAGAMAVGQRPFYHSLALLAQYPKIDETTQGPYLEKVITNQKQIKKWASHAPMNYQHKYDLVEAEKARILGNWEAVGLYEKAIAGARENQYLHEEALAYELAAEFYLGQGMDKFAQTYLKEAHYRYQQWGALAKVEDLEQRYPQFLAQISEAALLDKLRSTTTVLATRKISTTGGGQLSLLDLETVMKASQTLAGEMQLEKLLVHLMNIIIENAGAEKGFLLLEKHGHWLIEAEGTMTQTDIKVLQSVPLHNGLPTAMINYVAHTQKSVILDDATHEGEFTQTPYILTEKPKSILCVPLVHQGQLSGIVYLENNLATGTFTQRRVKMVRLLGSQAAISLDNARLYAELAEYNRTLEVKVTERTQELSQALENLKATQQELVQSEKMAALGQLVAGIAHEINTPLGAIRASIGNIVDGLNESVQQLPQLLQKLSLEQQRNFFTLLETALKNKKNLTSREERKIRRQLRNQLEEKEIENADEMADTLVDMGIYGEIDSFVSLFQSQHNPLILQMAYHLTMQQIHSQNILTAVERASKVVFALKSYARYDSESEMVKAKVTDGIDVVLTLYYNQLKHGIEATTHYQETPEILCYPDELNQVWTNLLHNAIQAMANQGILEISVAQQNEYIVVQITDSGKGIPADIQARIFEPFFTTKPAGEGSGLGLDIVQKIIDKHHGKIEVESQPGKTTFRVYLPKQ
jgi:signal transduction histidine kinase